MKLRSDHFASLLKTHSVAPTVPVIKLIPSGRPDLTMAHLSSLSLPNTPQRGPQTTPTPTLTLGPHYALIIWRTHTQDEPQRQLMTIRTVVTKPLLCARYIHTFSHFNPHNGPMRSVQLGAPFLDKQRGAGSSSVVTALLHCPAHESDIYGHGTLQSSRHFPFHHLM